MTKSHQTSKSSRLKTGLCGLAMLGLVSLVFTSIGCESGLSGNAIGEQSATPATNETDAEAPSGWELIGEESGFVTHRKAVEGSSVFAFRGETVVDVPLSKILTVFLDSDRRKDWVDRFSSSEDLESFGDFETVYWIRFGLPFPLTDRDYLLRVKADLDPNKRVFIANIKSVKSPKRGEMDCCIRAEAYRTYYRFESLPAQKKTKLEVEVHTDPKGMVPGWLVNMVQEDWPRETLLSLAREAGKDEVPNHSKFVAWDSLDSNAGSAKADANTPNSD